MEKDDILVFHTDGINSVVNSEGEHYKTEYISKILKENNQLSAEELIGRLKESIFSFFGGSALEDDISLIVLKMN